MVFLKNFALRLADSCGAKHSNRRDFYAVIDLDLSVVLGLWPILTVACGLLWPESDNFRTEVIRVIKKQLAILISVALMAITLAFPANAQTTFDTQIESTRSKVEMLRASGNSKVEVKLKDKTKIKGHITGVDQDSFIVSDSKTGTTQTVAYAEVSEVKKSGGSSLKPWLILGAVAAGVGITWAIVKPAVCDGGAQTRGIC